MEKPQRLSDLGKGTQLSRGTWCNEWLKSPRGNGYQQPLGWDEPTLGLALTEAQGHLGLSWLPSMPLGTAVPQAAATAVPESQEISVLIALFKWHACSSLGGT